MNPTFNPFNSYFILYLYREYKKPKKVQFSKKNQIYLIHTIEEIKEYLPDMYWKYDNTREFLPLKRNEFIFEEKTRHETHFRSHSFHCAHHSAPIPIKHTTIQSSHNYQTEKIPEIFQLKRSKSEPQFNKYNKYL
jgi:hypothetical protein